MEKKRTFMDRFFCFLLRTKSVLRLKNRSRTDKTDDFSSPDVNCMQNMKLTAKDAQEMSAVTLDF